MNYLGLHVKRKKKALEEHENSKIALIQLPKDRDGKVF